MSEHKLVNGVMVPVDANQNPPKAAPKGDRFTEVRLRQFYTNDDNGMVVMPTVVYYFKGDEVEKDMEVGALSAKLVKDINEQLPFPIRNMEPNEIAEELAKEIAVGSVVASQGKAALAVFSKNLKDEEPQKPANDSEPVK